MEGTRAKGLRKAGDGDGDEGAAENATVAIADITDIKKELDEMKYTQEAERQRMESAIHNYKVTVEGRMDRAEARMEGLVLSCHATRIVVQTLPRHGTPE